jgi:ADP-ribosyl-[dinitrogen reductase] hydrolase
MAARISIADRLAGGVWGHLVGDAMGVPYEGRPAKRIGVIRFGEKGTHRQPPGTWSDDGGLMLSLLDSLLKSGFDTRDQAGRALLWLLGPDYKPGPAFSIGGTTEEALVRIAQGIEPDEAGGADESNNGNGSLMKILPIALVGFELEPAVLMDWSFRASSITHAHPRSRITCALYSQVAAELLGGAEDRSRALSRALDKLEALVSRTNAHELQLIRAYEGRAGTGYAVDTFWSAWDAFAESQTYADTVRRAIAYGNDADTTAAVAGGLAGIYWGVGGIPAEWLEGMRGREIVDEVVARLLTAQSP